MQRLSCLWFLAACAYHPPTEPRGGDGDPPLGVDAPVEDPTPLATCMAVHADPALCLELEDKQDDVFLDGTSHRHDAQGNDVVELSRLMTPAIADHKALGFGPTSELVIAKDLGLEGDVTVEMWMQAGVNVASHPVLFDSSRRFFMKYDAGDREIRCGVNSDTSGLRTDSVTTVPSGWHHVACAFTAATREMKIYIDGNVAGCRTLSSTITARTGTTTIGFSSDFDHFVGALDSIHVYKRALGPGDVCKSAGKTSCATSCPIDLDIDIGGGGGGQGGPGGDD